MLSLLLVGDGTILAVVTTRAQLPLLLAQAPNVSTVAVGQATETDTALPVTVLLSGAAIIQVGIASETDTALPVTVNIPPGDQFVPVGLAQETDDALAVTFVASGDVFISVGIAEETNEALPILFRQTYLSPVDPQTHMALIPADPDDTLVLVPAEPAA
jgi:hypothetical protein